MPEDLEESSPDSETGTGARLLDEVALAFDCVARRATDATRASGSDASAAERLEASLIAVLEAAAEHPDLATLCLVEAPGLGRGAIVRKEAGLQKFIDLVEGELAHGGDRTAAAPLLAEMIVGGTYEVMQRRARALGAASLPELAGELRRLWLPALAGCR